MAVVDAESKININCVFCHKKNSKETGTECMMCGMILEDPGKEFCSKTCRDMFIKLGRKIN